MENNSFNLEDLTQELNFFEHEIYWFAVFKPKVDGATQQGVIHEEFCSKERVIELAKQYDGMGVVTVAINERPKGKTLGKDVNRVRILFIDVDITENLRGKDSGYVSLAEHHEYAIKKTKEEIIPFFQKLGFVVGLIKDSGNGVQIVLKCDIDIGTEEKRKEFVKKATFLEKTLMQEFDDNIIHIDVITKDVNRRIKLAGTINKKDTSQKEDRIARIIEYNDNPENVVRNTNAFMALSFVAECGNVETTKGKNKLKDETRSGQEWRYIRYELMEEKGIIDYAQINAEMEMTSFGKWKTATENYKHRTFNAAMESYNSKANKETEEDSIGTISQMFNILCDDYIVESFGDEEGIAWVHYKDGEKKMLAEVQGVEFSDFVRVKINDLVGEPKEGWITSILNLVESIARRNDTKELFVRSAQVGTAWFFDIGENKAVEIKNCIAKIVESPGIFRRFRIQKAISIDLTSNEKDIELLKPFLNMNEEDKELFINFLPIYFAPSICVSKPIIMSRGPPGSGKSAEGRIIKKIVDPSNCSDDGIAFPKDEKDWAAVTRQQFFSLFDNVDRLTSDQQDMCCRIITGTSINQRKLYTNLQTVQGKIKGAMAINGIDFTNLKSDFIDRTIINEKERVPDALRVPEETYYANLEKILPKIRGAAFKILARAQETLNEIEVPKELRLVDSARLAAACAKVRCGSEQQFLDTLLLKSQIQKDESIMQSLVAEPILEFMESRNEWEGPAKNLLKELTEQEYGKIQGYDTSEKIVISGVPRNWPKTPSELGVEIQRIAFLLRLRGLYISKPRSGGKRRIRIEKKDTSYGTDGTIDANSDGNSLKTWLKSNMSLNGINGTVSVPCATNVSTQKTGHDTSTITDAQPVANVPCVPLDL